MGVLQQVHRWFADPKYLGFVVISQTCDLVRRNGERCKTPYLEIAVVRPLRAYLLSLLKQQCDWIGDRYFPMSEKGRANELLDRVINQNESALGLFYLHPESSIGIAEESVALLRVSIALRADEHYETLIKARRGRLHPEFANKLGWLCGNLYSRVGIKDWKETEEDKKIATKLIKGLLDETEYLGPRFVECPKPLRKARENGTVDLRQATAAEIEAEIAKHVTAPYKTTAIEAIARILRDQGAEEALIRKVQQNLNNDPAFNSSVRTGTG